MIGNSDLWKRDVPVNDLVRHWAQQDPDKIAVVDGGQTVTYRELHKRAEAIGARLEEHGIRPGDRVGLLARRSAAAIAGILGTMRIGGVYVPLDPSSPKARLQYMLCDARVVALLTDNGKNVQGIDIDAPCVDIDSSCTPASPARRSVTATILPAYVMYTSGSTGRPKGVTVSHLALRNTIARASELYEIARDSRVLHAAPLNFDASILEVFLALTNGATLHVCDMQHAMANGTLGDVIDQQRITTLVVIPSLLGIIPDGAYPSLRVISLGGERCPSGLATAWYRRCKLLNVYAPTEAAIFATSYTVTHPAAWGTRGDGPPIGRPIGNMRAYVVDRELRPIPIGVVGEIQIGGIGLADYYVGLPATTAARFIPDSLGKKPGARLYRTGDLGRYLENGNIEWIGRHDDQVKVRGIRVEITEIEACLLTAHHVRDAAVVAVERREGDLRLVAFLSGDAGGISHQDVRRHLRQHLPHVMIPGDLRTVDSLPRLSNGKVDRAQLKQLARWHKPTVSTRPLSEEQRFVEVWRDVLEVRDVRPEDDFFETGGSSLLAVRLAARLSRELDVDVSPQLIFDVPVLEDLLSSVAAMRNAARRQRSRLRCLTSNRTGPTILLVHPAGGEVLCYRALAELLTSTVYGVRAVGEEGEDCTFSSVEDMAQRYAAAVAESRLSQPYVVGGWSTGGVVALEMARALDRVGQAVLRLCVIDGPAPWAIAEMEDWASGEERTAADRSASPVVAEGHDSRLWCQVAVTAGNDSLDAVIHDYTTQFGLGDEDLQQFILAAGRDIQLVTKHKPQPYHGAATYVRAVGSRSGSHDHVVDAWRALVDSLVIETIATDHYGILKPPAVRALAEILHTIAV